MLIGYARVSRTDQNLSLQVDALKKAGVDERNIFQEQMTGSIKDRPALKKALSYIKKDDVLVVYKLDRLGRSLSNLLEIMEDLKKKEVSFKSLTENIDTETVSGKLLFHIMAVLADFERSLIIERTNAGLASARSRGIKFGRKEALSNEQKEQVLAFWNEKKSLSYIARVMNVSRNPVRDVIKKAPSSKIGLNQTYDYLKD